MTIYLYCKEQLNTSKYPVVQVTKETLDDHLLDMLSGSAADVLWVTDDPETADRLKRYQVPLVGVESSITAEESATNKLNCTYILQDLKDIDDQMLYRIWQRCMGLPWDILETKRTRVRELALSDMDDLVELYNEPGVTDFIESLFEYEKEKQYQKDYIKYIYTYYEYGMWLVYAKRTGGLIGRMGIEHREGCEEWEAELGYVLHPAWQHQGIAREVCTAIIDYAKDTLELKKLKVSIHPYNFSSIELASNLGFRRTGMNEAGDVVMKLDLRDWPEILLQS